jgi:hypothetical protein
VPGLPFSLDFDVRKLAASEVIVFGFSYC